MRYRIKIRKRGEKMKKTITALLIAVLLVCSAGCGARSGSQDPAAEGTASTQAVGTIDLGSVMQEMLDTVSLPEMMTLAQDDLVDYFGLEPQWCADAAACINSNGYEKDEIILVRAADADSVPQIEACLQTTLENAAAEMQNYLPKQYEMIRNCSVQTRDLYVWLFISGAAEELQSVLDKQF